MNFNMNTTELFTKVLYNETKNSHNAIDNHPFVELIKTNKNIGRVYINFNKICINIIQDTFNQEFKKGNYTDFKECYNKLYRKILPNDFYISYNLNYLLIKCKEYPLEHAYMFYLGLLMGGNILTKFLPEYTDFLKFQESKKLITLFKNYLDTKITTKQEQERFIKIVNQSYSLVNMVFNDFLIKHNNVNKLNTKNN